MGFLALGSRGPENQKGGLALARAQHTSPPVSLSLPTQYLQCNLCIVHALYYYLCRIIIYCTARVLVLQSIVVGHSSDVVWVLFQYYEKSQHYEAKTPYEMVLVLL
jgi:hypothetical protein